MVVVQCFSVSLLLCFLFPLSAASKTSSAASFLLRQVDSKATSIAWAGDVDRFVNLDPEAVPDNWPRLVWRKKP